MSELKLTSYNIHSGIGADGQYSIERVARVIQKDHPDIVCLQEVEANSSTDRVGFNKDTSNVANIGNEDVYCDPIQTRIWSSVHNDDQSKAIASLLGFKYHIFAPAIRSRASNRWKEQHFNVYDEDITGNYHSMESNSQGSEHLNDANNSYSNMGGLRQNSGRFGIAILSKYPILHVKTHQYRRYKKKTMRNAIACLILLPNNKLIWVINTHLGCHFWGNEQLAQGRELVDFLYSLDDSFDIPSTFLFLDAKIDDYKNDERNNKKSHTRKISGVLLCGDFNSPPFFKSIREITRRGIHDVWPSCGEGIGSTFPSDGRVLGIPTWFGRSCRRRMRILRLDFIFVCQLFGGFDIDCLRAFVGCCDGEDEFVASDHLPLCAVFLIG